MGSNDGGTKNEQINDLSLKIVLLYLDAVYSILR